MTNDKQKGPLPEPQQGLSFDEALTHYIGEFGKGQLRIVGDLFQTQTSACKYACITFRSLSKRTVAPSATMVSLVYRLPSWCCAMRFSANHHHADMSCCDSWAAAFVAAATAASVAAVWLGVS
jgi:hypothetical protein